MIGMAVLMPGVTFEMIIAGPLLFNLFMVGLVVLVTFHRRRLDAEQRQLLINSEERYKLLIQQMPLAFIEWNQTRGIRAWNPAAERMEIPFMPSRSRSIFILRRSMIGTAVVQQNI
jgi:PAS domain-containing protein